MQTSTTQRAKMTPSEATNFAGVSIASVLQIQSAIADRAVQGTHVSCECQPYADVFTFARWKALGMSVKKGEKALRISTFAPTGRTRSETNDEGEETERAILRPVECCLFCRCQVEPSKELKGGNH